MIKKILFSIILLLIYISFSYASGAHTSSKDKPHIQKKGLVVKVFPFTYQADDPDGSWVSITTQRKIIELLANSGVTVLSPMTLPLTTHKQDFSIRGSVVKQDSMVKVQISLYNRMDVSFTSGELKGTTGFFRTIRNVLAESVMYALDIDPRTLVVRKTKKKPTSSNSAWGLYLLAKKRIISEEYDMAVSVLCDAVREDPSFAMACWSLSQVYREKGVEDSAALWNEKAQSIDANHPQWPQRDTINKEEPLRSLFEESKRQSFISADTGMVYKNIVLKKYDLLVSVWIADLHFFSLDILMQKKSTGSHIEDFLSGEKELLAINGGFFEMDENFALTPSGLIAKNGVLLNPFSPKGGSGIFYVKDRTPRIIWAKDAAEPLAFDVAFQCGPVIVESGGKNGIYKNDFIRLNRSAIGVSDSSVVMVIVSGKNGIGLSLYELAEFLRAKKADGGICCDAALNLDGGASSQAWFKFKNIKLSIPGLWAINSAIVMGRSSQ